MPAKPRIPKKRRITTRVKITEAQWDWIHGMNLLDGTPYPFESEEHEDQVRQKLNKPRREIHPAVKAEAEFWGKYDVERPIGVFNGERIYKLRDGTFINQHGEIIAKETTNTLH